MNRGWLGDWAYLAAAISGGSRESWCQSGVNGPGDTKNAWHPLIDGLTSGVRATLESVVDRRLRLADGSLSVRLDHHDTRNGEIILRLFRYKSSVFLVCAPLLIGPVPPLTPRHTFQLLPVNSLVAWHGLPDDTFADDVSIQGNRVGHLVRWQGNRFILNTAFVPIHYSHLACPCSCRSDR